MIQEYHRHISCSNTNIMRVSRIWLSTAGWRNNWLSTYFSDAFWPQSIFIDRMVYSQQLPAPESSTVARCWYTTPLYSAWLPQSLDTDILYNVYKFLEWQASFSSHGTWPSWFFSQVLFNMTGERWWARWMIWRCILVSSDCGVFQNLRCHMTSLGLNERVKQRRCHTLPGYLIGTIYYSHHHHRCRVKVAMRHFTYSIKVFCELPGSVNTVLY